MVITRKHLLILIALSASFLASAQLNSEIEYSKFPLKISVGNQAVGFPFENSFNAFHPHFSIGTEIGINKNLKHKLFAATNLGFIKNQVIGNTIILDLDLGYRYTAQRGLFIETALGIGILNQFHPSDIYVQDASTGNYESVKDEGTFASLIGLKMGTGYDFSRNSNLPIRVGVTHNFFIQTTYFDVASFPIMPQSTTNISITYKFKK